MQKNKGRMVTKVLTTAALLAALSAVIGIVCKNLLNNFQIFFKVLSCFKKCLSVILC